ncbi:MAG: phenylalanine--tRNA ligase subunit beta [Polyangiaceae bacterium]|nr:phenylalanine--tRNA ligase subunit beta [Polyangiaceae bacterium]
MRVSYRWLRELLPDLMASPSEVSERLTGAGLEVEASTPFGAGLDPVVVAMVRRIEPHPRRDKLRLVTVDRGSGEEQRVVCGAPNVPDPGGLVALAPLGTTLPAVGMTLNPRDIAGVVSEGMLCSEKELGVADAAPGILILPPGTATPGTPLPVALPSVTDTIFEVGITPNRADALSHVGIARDLAALYRIALRLPEVPPLPRVADAELAALVAVENRDFERCPHYGARVVVGVTVGPSPLWLRHRLTSLGLRPISNVVDVTNLILFEAGQPLHSFDLDRVRGARIIVRRARADEPFRTLDGVARTLDPDDLVIADTKGPSALAGVMGGAVSEIHEGTTRVLLECAYFAPRGIRRTSRRQGLSSDSSYRFERGVDFGALERVLDRATSLTAELGGGAAVRGAIHARSGLPEIPVLRLRSRRLDALLGTKVPFDEATAILDRLGLAVESVAETDGERVARVRGVSFRPDVKGEHDLIEEVARIRGFDAIPTVLPAILPQPPRASGKLERELGQIAVELGLSEALTYAFTSAEELAKVRAPAPVVSLLNPLSEERGVMRTSLLPGLFDALRRARRHGERSVRLFSIGTLFLPAATEARVGRAQAARPELAEDRGVLPEQVPAFAAVLAGSRPAYLDRREVDIYDATGLATELVARLTGRSAEVQHRRGEVGFAHLHPRGAAAILVDGVRLGSLGPVHPEVIDALDLDGPAFTVELSLSALEAIEPRVPHYRPLPRLPATTRDLSVEVPEELLAGELFDAIRGAAGELCEAVELLDVFAGAPVPPGRRSLTYRLTYRDPKTATEPDRARTLTDREVDQAQARVHEAAARLGARLRT